MLEKILEIVHELEKTDDVSFSDCRAATNTIWLTFRNFEGFTEDGDEIFRTIIRDDLVAKIWELLESTVTPETKPKRFLDPDYIVDGVKIFIDYNYNDV